VTSESEVLVPVAEEEEREEVEVVRAVVPLLWCATEDVADEAEATAAAVVELESVEVSVAEADEEEELALGAALLVLSITNGGV
jgi:hypothetical protein